jgi:hypothetical protein
MRVRSELSKLHQGLGLFKIVGGGFGTGLYFDGQPISIFWHDWGGSVAQYLAHVKILNNEANLLAIRNFVEGQVAETHGLAKQIKPLFKMFESGEYQLNLLDEFSLSLWSEYPGEALNQDFKEDIGWFYPLYPSVIATRPKRFLNHERIKFYEASLTRGQRPIVITASVIEGYARFVIDGHHKLQAYENLNIAPRVLQIVKQVESFVTEEDIEAFLSTYPNAAKHYRRHNY